MTAPIKLVVGLGNPGKKYEGTRHNVGRAIVEALQRAALPGRWLVTECFMNDSGREVAQLAQKNGLRPDEVLVVLDEFQIPLGQVKILPSGSDGGHNGMKSVIEWLKTPDVPRLRIGIGPLPELNDPAEWVLKRFSSTEQKMIDHLWPDYEGAVSTVLTLGLDAAMNKFNGRPLA